MLNVLDAAILLTVLLVVNLNNFDFSKAAMAGLIYTLLFIPMTLLFGIGIKKLLHSFQTKFQIPNDTINLHTVERYVSMCSHKINVLS